MSEGMKVDGRNMDENIISSTSETTMMTEVIRELTSDDEETQVERNEATPSIMLLTTTISLESTNNAAPEVPLSENVNVDINEEDVNEKSVMSLAKPSIMCRICLMNEECERLVTPCQCKGTHAFVHRHCLECWLSCSGLSHCELCLFHFATVYQLRYGLWESMRIWFSHPTNRALLQSDILLCTLLTIITFGLVVASMFGMYYLTASPNASVRLSRYWTETSIGVFLGIVIVALVLNTIIVIKANIVPWFRWWRRCREIQLVIRDNNNNANNV